MNTFFGTNTIKVVPLVHWLNWASGNDCNHKSVFVALPMLQRSSVWKPNQLIDLWDSMLRGMPLGSLMVNSLKKDTPIRRIGKSKMERLEEDGIGLLDGQQRTLSMLLGWPMPESEEPMNRRIWIDFADVPGTEHLFRLRVTSANQPYGFRRDLPSAKLELSIRRKAREGYLAEHGPCVTEQDDQKGKWTPNLDKSRPYSAGHSLALNLKTLVEIWIATDRNRSQWVSQVKDLLETLDGYREVVQPDGASQWQKYRVWQALDPEVRTVVEDRVERFAHALGRLFAMEIPLIHVEIDDDVDSIDPPLAILFKRVGSGGTNLSDEDYVYSVIKHRVPETYQLVEDLLRESHIAAMLSATDIVMTTVRLTAAQHAKANGSSFPDHESMDKRQFHTLLKEEILLGTSSIGDSKRDFLKDALLPTLRSDADSVSMLNIFTDMHALIEYKARVDGVAGLDIGLPPHALPLLQRPLLQVIARWVQLAHLENQREALLTNRSEVIRFALFWMFAVRDSKKASKLAFEVLGKKFGPFPGRELYRTLIEKQVAVSLFSPNALREAKANLIYTSTPHLDKPLRGWSRFSKGATAKEERAREMYQRWWNRRDYGHVHPLLLWLQRDFVANFEGMPVAGKEDDTSDDTPYDYDHICALNLWSNWTGIPAGTRIMDFGEHQAVIGNAIGNVRVWDSSMNRSDGASLPDQKLLLDAENEIDRDRRLAESAIHQDQMPYWHKCSIAKGTDSRAWDVDRTIAFQHAVESRTFDLYIRYFNDLDFAQWDVDAVLNPDVLPA